jgi:hypothetical protein
MLVSKPTSAWYRYLGWKNYIGHGDRFGTVAEWK